MLVSRIFCQKGVRVNFRNFHIVFPWFSLHTVWKQEFLSYLPLKNISSNQLFSNFFSKNVVFMKFLSVKCALKFTLTICYKNFSLLHNGEFRKLRKGTIGFCTLKAAFHPKGWIAKPEGRIVFNPKGRSPRDEIWFFLKVAIYPEGWNKAWRLQNPMRDASWP